MSGSGCSAGDPALVLGGSTWRDSRRPGSSSTSPRSTPVTPEALAPLLWPRLALCSQPLPAVPPVPAPSSWPADLRESFPDAGTVPCSRLSRCGLPRSRGLARCQAHFPGSARVALHPIPSCAAASGAPARHCPRSESRNRALPGPVGSGEPPCPEDGTQDTRPGLVSREAPTTARLWATPGTPGLCWLPRGLSRGGPGQRWGTVSQQEAESAGKAGLLEQEGVGMPAGSGGCAVGRHGGCPRLSLLSCYPQPSLSDDTQTCPWFVLRSPLASRGVMLGLTDHPSRGLGIGGLGVSPSC